MKIAVQLKGYIGFLTNVFAYVMLDQARTVQILCDPQQCLLSRLCSMSFRLEHTKLQNYEC